MVNPAFKPWLWLPPQWAHDLSPFFLKLYGSLHSPQTLTWKSFTWRNLQFSNPLGIAGGLDKNANQIQDWWTLGPGFVEVGTITPQPQRSNPGRIMARNCKEMAIWNKMGFPSRGTDYVLCKLKNLQQPHFTPIFVNIGKNRDTTNEEAIRDYQFCMQKLSTHADAFVINISSPNTPNLRSLLQPQYLEPFLAALNEANSQRKPMLLKLSPDLNRTELTKILDLSCQQGIDGWILTNTTTKRNTSTEFPENGGLSGQPLAAQAKSFLRWTIESLGERRQGKLIVSCGGALSAQDVFERLDLGADLVQVYSALVFFGPFFFRNVADKALMRF